MKYLLTILMGLMISLNVFSQTEYPKIISDSTGKQFVVMTIEQAQKLDNGTDLLALFEKMNAQIGSYDSVCVKVINEQKIVIATQEIQMKNLKDQADIRSREIDNLKSQINNYKEDLTGCETQKKNDEKIIQNQKDQIGKLKLQRLIGGVGGGAIIIGLVLALIL